MSSFDRGTPTGDGADTAAAGLIVAAGITALSTKRNASTTAKRIAHDWLAAVGEKARAAGVSASALDVLSTRFAGHDMAGAMRDAKNIAKAIGPAVVLAIFNVNEEGQE